MIRRWTASENDLLRKFYPDREKCERLLPGRTWQAMKRQARKVGATRAIQLWSSQEDDLLRRSYRNRKKTEGLIPGRTKQAIKSRARDLGLTRPDKPWTAAATRRAERMALSGHSDVEIASATGRTVRAVCFKLSRLKLRPLRMGAGSVFPIARDIRERCLSERVPLVRLYRYIGTGPFLREQELRRFNAIHPAIFDVVEALGGELYVEWED